MFGTVVIFGKAKAEVSIVPFQTESLTYNGTAQSPVLGGFNESVMELGGVTSTVDAGTYAASVSLKEGYVWSDGTLGPKSVTWTIARASTAVPTVSGSKPYNGSKQTVSLSGYDSAKMTLGGIYDECISAVETALCELDELMSAGGEEG